MKKIILLLNLFLSSFLLFSQGVGFEKTFGTNPIDYWVYNYGMSIIQTNDSNYALTGCLYKNGQSGGYIMGYTSKINQQGDVIWAKDISSSIISNIYGPITSTWGTSIIQTFDQNLIIGGINLEVDSNNGNTKWNSGIIKANQNGSTIFNKNYSGNPTYSGEFLNKIIQTKDSGFVLTGRIQYINTDSIYWNNPNLHESFEYCYIRKLDKDGNEIWRKIISNQQSAGSSLAQLNDGSIIVSGKVADSNAVNTDDILLVKLDLNGNKKWEKHLGGSNQDYAFDIKKTSDGNIILASSTMSYGNGGYDASLIKVDTGGNIIWQKQFGGFDDDYGNHVNQTKDGGYILIGSTENFNSHGLSDVYIVKTDALGIEQWSKTYGGVDADYGYAIEQTFDGGYILSGHRNGLIYVMKLNNQGLVTNVSSVNLSKTDIQLFPNPSLGLFSIQSKVNIVEIVVSTIQGQKIIRSSINSKESTIDLSTQPAGIYFVTVKTDKGNYTEKIMLEK
jgi:hypothetical protein